MSDDEPLLWTAAKAVAEQRQHGCHAEWACPECLAIAEAVLRSVVLEVPPDGALIRMARAALTHVDHAHAAYRAMPVWQVLWRFK